MNWYNFLSDNAVKTATSQGPVVAKVLTNAAGQVISVESLLAHQKQGTLTQGKWQKHFVYMFSGW